MNSYCVSYTRCTASPYGTHLQAAQQCVHELHLMLVQADLGHCRTTERAVQRRAQVRQPLHTAARETGVGGVVLGSGVGGACMRWITNRVARTRGGVY